MQTLGVLRSLLPRVAVDLVPVLRRGDRHIAHQKIFVQPVERRRRAPSAAGDRARADFALPAPAARVEQAVEQGAELPRRPRVVYGRADDEGGVFVRGGEDLVYGVVKDALARFAARSARYAAGDGLLSDIPCFAFDSAPFERRRNLFEREGCAAVFVRASVDEQDFFHSSHYSAFFDKLKARFVSGHHSSLQIARPVVELRV